MLQQLPYTFQGTPSFVGSFNQLAKSADVISNVTECAPESEEMKRDVELDDTPQVASEVSARERVLVMLWWNVIVCLLNVQRFICYLPVCCKVTERDCSCGQILSVLLWLPLKSMILLQ